MGEEIPDREHADPTTATAVPWWVRLSRLLNGGRICAVPDCIELTEPDAPHCRTHLRELRSRHGEGCCAEEHCVAPAAPDSALCTMHAEAAFIAACIAPAPEYRWN